MFTCLKSVGLALLFSLSFGLGSATANEISFENLGRDAFGNPGWVSEVEFTVLGESYTTEAGVYRLVDANNRIVVEAFCLNVFGCNEPEGDFSIWSWLPKAVSQRINQLYVQSYDDVRDSRSAAAFQLALWEIVTDSATGLDLSSGNFQADGDGYTYMLAQRYIDRLTTEKKSGSARRLFTAASEGAAVVAITVPMTTARIRYLKRA